MKGHYAGKSHAHKDMKKESKKKLGRKKVNVKEYRYA